ncbi:hypothetical protein D3C86_1744920 [compost metagenome]
MNSGHQAFNDTEVVVDNFSQWSQAVGGARCVRNDILASILLEVCAFNEHRGVVFGRTSQNNFLRTRSDVFTRRFVGQEQTRCFSNNVNVNFVPLQVSRVTFCGNTDSFAVNNQVAVFDFYSAVETTVS